MPLPETMSELSFAGVLKESAPMWCGRSPSPLIFQPLQKSLLEGTVSIADTALEGPYGDHTGYYNSVEPFPVMTLRR